MATLREAGIRAQLLFTPTDPVGDLVLVPGLRSARRTRGMFGYFTSSALAQLAPGLAEYLVRDSAPLTLIVSPEIHERDYEAVERGLRSAESVLEERMAALLTDAEALESELAMHAAECLAWLLRSGRLEVLVAFPRRSRFHPKIWEFADKDGDLVVVRGSGNATASGVSSNVEQMDVDVSWDGSSAEKLKRTVLELDALQQGTSSLVAAVYPLEDAVARGWIETWGSGQPPTPSEYERIVERMARKEVAAEPPEPPWDSGGFEIPSGLEYLSGPYAHQGAAVEAWESAGRRGILQMATGAGKTITALIAARRLLEQVPQLMIVVSAPTRPLVRQWTEECAEFGLRAVDTSRLSNRAKRFEAIDRAFRSVVFGSQPVSCVVVTNNLLNDLEFRRRLTGVSCPVLLIGDEVHTLGAAGFASNPPNSVPYRLGLSATPVRQHDDDGTAALTEFFGDVVYEFGLEKAIGLCLVPYDYYVHSVSLSDAEGSEFVDLSNKISVLMAKQKEKGLTEQESDRLKLLLIQRRRIVEVAEAKIPELTAVVGASDPRRMSHTLFYGSAKDPEQLRTVNGMLGDFGVTYHQITQQESSDERLLADLLQSFQSGDIQALTAKKVLDEGLNIPEITTAFILASSTVEREWVQRRGRILRKSPGKSKAVLHDFLVLPPSDVPDSTVLSVLRGELSRIREFGALALNAGSEKGALAIANRLILDHLPRGGPDGSQPF